MTDDPTPEEAANSVYTHAIRFCSAARVLASGNQGTYLNIWLPLDQPSGVAELNLLGATLVGSSLCGGILRGCLRLPQGVPVHVNHLQLRAAAKALGLEIDDRREAGIRCLEAGVNCDFRRVLRLVKDREAACGLKGLFETVDYLQTTFVELGGHLLPLPCAPQGGAGEWGTSVR